MFLYLCRMNTRQYTKLLKENPHISTFEIKSSHINGTITITRFRPHTTKTIHTTGASGDGISYKTDVGNEVDLEFKGEIHSRFMDWLDAKNYNKNTLSRWLRNNSSFRFFVHNRTSVIGGDRNTIIKKITMI